MRRHESMHYLLSCFIQTLLLFHGISLIEGQFDSYKYGAPLDLDCFKDIVIPDEPIDKNFSRSTERQVLHQFYIETSIGQNWTIDKGWSSFANSEPDLVIDQCNWAGVTCSKDGYVTGLSLKTNNLSGRVPSFLWKLRNLRVLCLPGNELYGSLEEFIFPNMTKLLRIDLAFCYLSGNLPKSAFAALKFLQKIQLSGQKSDSKLYGSIPDNISYMKDLQVLSLGENMFTGPIPRGIGKLKKVWFFDLEFMEGLSGNISWFLGMTSLRHMHLSKAGIYGELPDDFGFCFPSMMELQIPENPGISGQIPSSFDNMVNLTKIIMHNIKSIRGIIPKALGNLPQLMILDLTSNSLQGLDDELNFKGAPRLEILLLGNNHLLSAKAQTLIDALMSTDSLRILNISSCDFYGSIDSRIWKLKSLIELDIKWNRVGGQLPEVYTDLMFLTYLDLSHNDFEGSIPGNFKLLQSLMLIDIRGNSKMTAPEYKVNVTSREIQGFMRVNQCFRQKNVDHSCPFGTLISTNGSVLFDPTYYDYRFCLCGEGFYGSLNMCKRCMKHGDCTVERPEMISNSEQIFMKIRRGFYPSPSAENTTHLVPCPSLLSEKDWACNPFGDCKCWLNETSRTTVCNKSCICRAGSKNWLCSQCSQGYYKSGSLCIKCDTDSTELDFYSLVPLVIIILLFIWITTYFCEQSIKARFALAVLEFIFLIIFRLAKVIEGWFLEVGLVLVVFNLAGLTQNIRSVMSILVFYIQILDAMISVNNSAFPDFVTSIQHYMSSVMNLDFTGISCKVPILFTPLGNYLLIFFFPMACLLLIWMFYGARAVTMRILGLAQEQNPGPLRNTLSLCKKASIACICLMFFPVSKQTIALLAPCKHDGQSYYLAIAPWVKCSKNDESYPVLQMFGWLGLTMYVMGVPIFLMSLLIWYNRNKDKFTEQSRQLCDAWLGAIYLPYEERGRYFEILKLLRKLLIAIFLAVFVDSSTIQNFSVSIVLFIALIFHLTSNPYRIHAHEKSFDNFLEKVTLGVLHLSFMMLRLATLDVESSSFLVWIVILLNLGVSIVFMVVIVSVVINTSCNSQEQGERQPILRPN